MEIKDVFGSDHYVQLEIVERNLDELRAKYEELSGIGFVSPEIEDAYRRAIEAQESNIADLAQDPDFQKTVASLGLESITGIEQIEPLEHALPKSEFLDLKGQYLHNCFRVTEFFRKHGPVTEEAINYLKKVAAGGFVTNQTVEVAQVTTDETLAAPETLPKKRDIAIRVGTKNVRINGRVI